MKSTGPAARALGKPADAFDPYYTWLGIPPRDQPPHHYRLLGLEPFETNLEAIDNASNRQMSHLRNCSAGPRASVAQELLNKVAAARVCLLDVTRKANYDERLREELSPSAPESALPEPAAPPTALPEATLPLAPPAAPPTAPPEATLLPVPPAAPAAAVLIEPAVPTAALSYPSRRTKRVRPKNPAMEVVRIALGGLVGLGLGYVLITIVVPDLVGIRSQSATGLPDPMADRPAAETPSSAAASSAAASDFSSDSTSTQVPESMRPSVTIANVAANRSQGSTPATTSPADGNSGLKVATSDPARNTTPGPVSSEPVATPATSSVPPSPSQAARELDQFPASVALPPMEATSWQTLLPLPKIPDRIELVPAFDPDAAKMSLKLETVDAACDASRWRVLVQLADSPASNSATSTLCEWQIDATSGDLQFRWQSANPETAAALANSWLRFAFEEQTRFLALRHPQRVAPLKLSFDKGRHVVPLAVESVPATSHVVLEVSSLAGLPGSPALRNGASQALIDREMVIEFSDLPGARITIKLSKIAQAPLGLIVEPRFKEAANREYDLTYSKLIDATRGISNALKEARGSIAVLTKILESAQPALRAANERKVQNKAEAAKKVLDISRLDGIVRNATAKLRAEREKEADAQSRLNNVPRIEAFMRSLDGKEVLFRVAVKSDSAELVLVRGANDGGTR